MNVRPLALLGMVLGTTGCARAYRPPTAAEPHATVKVRRVFERSAGTRLNEIASVNGRVIERDHADARLADAPRSSALFVHPRPARFEVGAGFSHFEQRTVQESYVVQESYMATESYSCGTGTSYRTCSRTVTRYRSVTKYRWVTKMVEVSDGSCASSITFSPQTGHIYIVDYTYRERGACSATCIEQIAILTDGSFRSAPCPALTASEMKVIAEDEDDDD